LQLESGEYFLKVHEKETQEAERRKQKVILISLSWRMNLTEQQLSAIRNDHQTTAKRRAEAFLRPQKSPLDHRTKAASKMQCGGS